MSSGSRTFEGIKLPHLLSVNLNGFAIYQKRNGNVDLDVSKNVYCLAGANGLGKSTLLTAIIFGFCGFLRKQTTERISLSKRRPKGESYAQEYFSGRINELNANTASITLEFLLGQYRYKITRNIFSRGELQDLQISDNSTGSCIYDNDGQNLKKRLSDYESHISNHSFLESFDRFAFVVQYILAFDENHHLLFWDSEALEDALFSCIGLRPSLAQEAQKLRDKLGQTESKRRNAQYAKTQATRLLKESRKMLKLDEDIVIDKTQLKALQNELKEAKESLELKTSEIDSENTLMAQHTHTRMLLENDYRATFEELTTKRSNLPFEVELRESLNVHECFGCKSSTPESMEKIEEILEKNRCFICDSELKSDRSSSSDTISQKLSDLDKNISEISNKIQNSSAKIARCHEEKNKLESIVKTLEKKNQQVDSPMADFEEKLELFEKSIAEYDKSIADIKKRYSKCISELEAKYLEIENEFVPLFSELAHQFLGLPISIVLVRPKKVNSKKPLLELSVNGSQRGVMHQLSESQRFFLDIALKMSLIQFATGKEANVTMLLDTPEGSLDIAYESKVGEMFASFVNKNKSLFITANLNSSELLKRLAQQCTSEKMHLERMIDWADLTSIQQQEEGLFKKAYEDITAKLEA